MFFKELACFILFSYQCSSTALIYFVRDSFYILSCVTFFVNNFFQLFLTLFSLFQRRLLKLVFILLICCCRVQQPWLIYTPVQQKSTIFFKLFFKKALWLIRTIFFFFFVRFVHPLFILETKRAATWWQPYLFVYLLNNSIPAFTLAIVSSLPIISIISVAPAGVICFPETAVLIGQSA